MRHVHNTIVICAVYDRLDKQQFWCRTKVRPSGRHLTYITKNRTFLTKLRRITLKRKEKLKFDFLQYCIGKK